MMGVEPSKQSFGSECFSPQEIEANVEKMGIKKARSPLMASLLQAFLAGLYIGLGGLFFCIVLADTTLGFAAQRLLGGLVFALGLGLVAIAGGELFTGNCLIVMAWFQGQIRAWEVLKNWSIIWVGNFIGALTLVFLVFMSHHYAMNNGEVGNAVVKLAVSKLSPDFTTIFFKGILCNILVCLGMWMSYAGKSVADKMAGLVLPVAAFIAAGFEHCIANMYLLPLAYVLVQHGHVPAGLDVSVVTIPAIIHNLIPATLGNIVGGGFFVGFIYWAIYRKAYQH
ncbi:MAG: formate/nitrite transporter family protein [Rhizomicrobium sp.]|nr:formate/nitrite transporter family protein [Rhizomicrobium sp.]